jgi:uncharacterized protein
MNTTEIKQYAAIVDAADDGALNLTAAVFGNVDRQGEAIAKGAFTNLDGFAADGWIAVNHDWDALPIATVESASQDGEGLKVAARFHSTPEAQAARTVIRERLERGKSVKASIGFRVLDSRRERLEGKDVRVLTAVELYEASIVNLPANPRAGVTGVKGAWWADYEAAFAALKEGRAISTSRRNRIAGIIPNLRTAADDLDALLAETDPTPRGDLTPEPESDPLKSAAIVARARARVAAIVAAPYLLRY